MSDLLAACDKPQVAQSLSELGAQHRPSKFGYMGRRRPFTHAQFDTIYPLFLEELRTKEFKLLEIGLDTGASLRTWLDYFPCAEVHGVDLHNTSTPSVGHRVVTTHAGDASDPAFVDHLLQAAQFVVASPFGLYNISASLCRRRAPLMS